MRPSSLEEMDKDSEDERLMQEEMDRPQQMKVEYYDDGMGYNDDGEGYYDDENQDVVQPLPKNHHNANCRKVWHKMNENNIACNIDDNGLVKMFESSARIMECSIEFFNCVGV